MRMKLRGEESKESADDLMKFKGCLEREQEIPDGLACQLQ